MARNSQEIDDLAEIKLMVRTALRLGLTVCVDLGFTGHFLTIDGKTAIAITARCAHHVIYYRYQLAVNYNSPVRVTSCAYSKYSGIHPDLNYE